MSMSMLFVLAASTHVGAQAISHAYDADGTVQKGMIVMIDPKNSNKIKPLTNKNDAAMHGVVVAANDTILSFGGDGTTSQVYVANDGKYQVLVSNQNGPITKGDIVTISAIDGIGMKVDVNESVVLGKALTGFDGKNNVSGYMTLKTSTGNKKVAIGMIVVDIGIAHNPIQVSVNGPPVPAFMKRAGEAITGKTVSTWRIYIALIILLVTVFITGNLLYGGVKSSLVAIGRNPLAKGAVTRGLVQVIVLGVIIFVLGLFSIYLILKL
jgi:hypothetical protein